MLLKALLSFLLFFPSIASAEKMSHGAHVHGAVALDIAVEGNQLLIMMKSASDSILGFERKEKTKAEKAKIKKEKNLWLKDNSKLFKTTAELGCKIAKKSWKIERQSVTHSEVVGELQYKCDKALNGSVLKVMIKSIYPKTEKISIQMIKADGSVLEKTETNAEFELTL